MKTSILFIVLISSFVIDVFGCGFGSLGGGGGGGCGCSNPCGRKKREVSLVYQNMNDLFSGSIAGTSSPNRRSNFVSTNGMEKNHGRCEYLNSVLEILINHFSPQRGKLRLQNLPFKALCTRNMTQNSLFFVVPLTKSLNLLQMVKDFVSIPKTT